MEISGVREDVKLGWTGTGPPMEVGSGMDTRTWPVALLEAMGTPPSDGADIHPPGGAILTRTGDLADRPKNASKIDQACRECLRARPSRN
jgi:hypothetical protein